MNKIFLVKDEQELKGKITGVIPAIVCGHMQAPSISCRVDYTVFKKTDKEKGELLTAKHHNKEDRKRHYGKNYKNFLNVPDSSIEGSIHLRF